MNPGTIIVSLVLIVLVAGIIIRLRKDRKKGKSSCIRASSVREHVS